MNARSLPSTQGIGLHYAAVGKSFGDATVLQDLNLQIRPGEFVAIVGRSGCGKSTLLRLTAGLDPITSGQLHTTAVGHNTDVRMMFQDARLLPWKSVIRNVALGLSADAWSAAEDALRQVGLADRAQAWPAALSGGQRQRVALARALVHHPALLLLDEPLGALDALTRIEMQQLIESIWATHGFTAILVTHDVAEAIALADRVLLIEEGRIGLDLAIDLPRPRSRGSVEFAHLEAQVLERVLRQPEHVLPIVNRRHDPIQVAVSQLRWAL